MLAQVPPTVRKLMLPSLPVTPNDYNNTDYIAEKKNTNRSNKTIRYAFILYQSVTSLEMLSHLKVKYFSVNVHIG